MKESAILLFAIALVIVLTDALPLAQAQDAAYFPARDTWERRAPADVGMNDARLKTAIDSALRMEMPGRDFAAQRSDPGQLGPLPPVRAGVNGIILRHGYIVAEFGDTLKADPSYSVAKSYLSTLAGLALDRRLIASLTDPVARYVSDGGYSSAHNAAITWEQHLRQTSEWDGALFGKAASSSCTSADGAALTAPLQAPGTVFEYNDVRVNRLSLSMLQVWKRPLPEVLKTEIMDPIGASDTWSWVGYDNARVDIGGQTMISVPGGTRWGGGLWMSTRDHARFGLLMLRNGRWNDRQIISEAWIRQATTPSGPGGHPNYGYLWWLNANGLWSDAGRASFAASGDGPNMIWIDPELDLVVVLRWFRGTENEFLKLVLEAVEPIRPVQPTRRVPFDVPADWPEVLEPGGDVKLPRRITQVPLVPPPGIALRGNLVVQVLIAPDGVVRDAKVMSAGLPPDIALAEAGLKAARQWVFAPTVVDGVAHPVLLKNAFLLDRMRCRQ